MHFAELVERYVDTTNPTEALPGGYGWQILLRGIFDGNETPSPHIGFGAALLDCNDDAAALVIMATSLPGTPPPSWEVLSAAHIVATTLENVLGATLWPPTIPNPA